METNEVGITSKALSTEVDSWVFATRVGMAATSLVSEVDAHLLDITIISVEVFVVKERNRKNEPYNYFIIG